ncbi:hypothetical protein [Flavobacterium sp. 3HN19-14]
MKILPDPDKMTPEESDKLITRILWFAIGFILGSSGMFMLAINSIHQNR